MAHAALVGPDGIVRDVHVIANGDLEHDGQWPASESSLRAFQSRLGLDVIGCTWYQCSYSASFRGSFPSAGWLYDQASDVFVAPTISAP